MEIAIISGKGGTGKTSISAGIIANFESAVVVDADVDAANLHILLQPQKYKESRYESGKEAYINYDACTHCAICQNYCRFGAIENTNGHIHINPLACDGCELCVRVCPHEAIEVKVNDKSRWYASHIAQGYMTHARLAPGEENSGKLVQIIRHEAQQLATNHQIEHIIIDGPPGTGCPVISAITGVDKAIIVTEPSLSAFHDLKRAAALTAQFAIPTYIIINKSTMHNIIANTIRNWCADNACTILAELPFDTQIVEAMEACKNIQDYAPNSQISKKLHEVALKIKQ